MTTLSSLFEHHIREYVRCTQLGLCRCGQLSATGKGNEGAKVSPCKDEGIGLRHDLGIRQALGLLAWQLVLGSEQPGDETALLGDR